MVVLTQLPLKSILRNVDYTGRVAKWGTILGAFDIKYMPRTSIKGQVLADLVAKFVKCPEKMSMEKHGVDEKISWPNLCLVFHALGGVCGWGSKPVRIRSGANSSIS